jgi:hypothetical protein
LDVFILRQILRMISLRTWYAVVFGSAVFAALVTWGKPLVRALASLGLIL